MNKYSLLFVVILSCLNYSCSDDDEYEDIITEEDKRPESVLAGGETTIFSSGPDAYTFPLPNLDSEGMAKHAESDAAFEQQFVTAPADNFDGVGPQFNQNACVACHVRNGRGNVPQFTGDPNSGLSMRMSLPGVGANNGIVPVPGFGSQLQNKAIVGKMPEGQLSKTISERVITYDDGTTTTIYKPTYYIVDTYTELPGDVLISPRIAPAVHGLGLLEAIPEEDILLEADVNDLDNDGISGKPNMVYNVLEDKMELGRFGWKAIMPTAGQQAADAAHNDMGLTNFYFPEEQSKGQSNATSGLKSGNDIDAEMVNLMEFYFQTLAVPAQRDYDDENVLKGKALFSSLQCVACHKPKQITGSHEIEALSNQTIYPYTDLLLHDMGEGLADNRPVFDANGKEWRTPPLWGIGLAQRINPDTSFLHDGRAKTLEEAILWHGGEAQQSTDKFKSLSQSERGDLIEYLKSL